MNSMEVKLILECIKTLVSVAGSRDSVDIPADEGLNRQLKSNLTSYKALLATPGYNELSKRIEAHTHSLRETIQCNRDESPTISLYQEFTEEALALAAVLADSLHSLHVEDQQDVGVRNAPGHPPTAPRSLLSVSDQKTVRSVFEFIVSMGLYPYLLPGVDNFLKMRLSNVSSIAKASSLTPKSRNANLCRCCLVVTSCFDNEVFGPLILTRHFSDVAGALIQVCYAPAASESQSDEPGRSKFTQQKHRFASPADITQTVHSKKSVKDTCLEMLQGLLRKTYQPLVIKELLILQGMPSSRGVTKGNGGGSRSKVASSPKWLRKACGMMLSERLMGRNGVQHVISGVMEVTTGM